MPISDNWPCVYWNDEYGLLLIVYVDGMKIAGPRIHMQAAWAALGESIVLEEPQSNEEGKHTFL